MSEVLKQAAAAHAVTLVKDGMTLGLGTGTTMAWFVRFLGERVAQGLTVRGIATSGQTARLAEEAGIPLVAPEDMPAPDLAVDGADEIDPALRLIKGGGGALLREKIVAAAAHSLVIVADDSKLVEKLGVFPLPVEVDPFGASCTARSIKSCLEKSGLPGVVVLRKGKDREPYITDGGHVIYDCHTGFLESPETLAAALDAIPGVLGHGLFVNLANRAVIAGVDGIHIMEAQQ